MHAAVESPLDRTVARATSNANAGNIDEFETNQLYASNSLIHKLIELILLIRLRYKVN